MHYPEVPVPAILPTVRQVVRLCMVVITVGTGCSKTPVTERVQFNLIPDGIMTPLGRTTYREMLSSERLETGTQRHVRLKKVGRRVSKVANRKDYKWRYALIKDDDTINAWCLPGGKIAFYSGILPVLRNEAGMSFVMGHEVAHATAHHSAERLSQQLAFAGGIAALYMYLDGNTDLKDETKNLIIGALGLGTQLGFVLPFSRKHEKEADIIGMMYMARAGYPPEEAVKVWSRMNQASDGGRMPVFLSTHPSHGQRKRNLRDWMPQAQKRYARNALAEDTQRVVWPANSR